MGELRATEPWETVSIDFITDLPATRDGNKHLLVCCDHFTRWVETFPLPDMKATTVASVLVNELFSRFGCSKNLHSDCAANFRGELMKELCRLMGVRKTFTTSGHPQGNSRCERVNRTVLGMLSKYLSDNHAEWDKHLPLLILAYRSQVHKSLGFSPFFLMFGREPHLPVDSEIDAPRSFRSRTISEYVDELCAGLRDAYRDAIRMSDASNSRNKALYDRKLNTFTYRNGDPVMLYRNVARRGEYYKFVRPWKPAVVVSSIGDLNYRVRLEDGKMLSVHHNRLKPRHPSFQDSVSVPVRPTVAERVSEGAQDGQSDTHDFSEKGEEDSLICVVSDPTRSLGVQSGSRGVPLSSPDSPVPVSAAVAPVPAPRLRGPSPDISEQSLPSSRVDEHPVWDAVAPVPPVPLRRSGREKRPPDRLSYKSLGDIGE